MFDIETADSEEGVDAAIQRAKKKGWECALRRFSSANNEEERKGIVSIVARCGYDLRGGDEPSIYNRMLEEMKKHVKE